MNFGEKLKMLRTGQKLSQRELAERLGVAKSVISYYESGDRYPSYDVLVKMAHLFHVTTDYLLDIDKVRTVDVSNLTVPGEFMVDKIYATPGDVTVKGPENSVNLISKIVATVESQEITFVPNAEEEEASYELGKKLAQACKEL